MAKSGSGWGRTRSGSTFEQWQASRRRQSAKGRRSEYREELPF